MTKQINTSITIKESKQKLRDSTIKFEIQPKWIVFVLVTLLLMSSHKMVAQESKETELETKSNSILFSPFNLLDPINPSFQLGYERLLNQKWAVQIEGGYIINKGLFNILLDPDQNPDEYTNKGYKLRFELKRTLVLQKWYKLYSSCEVFYLKNKSDVFNQYISDPSHTYSFDTSTNNNKSIHYFDYYTNDKTKYGINIKAGVKGFAGPIFIEGYLGIGIAHRNNIHSNRENKSDTHLEDSFVKGTTQGDKIILSIPINIKFGYRF